MDKVNQDTNLSATDTATTSGRKDSPFFNELILECIFSYLLNIQDLLSCRLVSLQWANLGCKILKTFHHLTVPVNICGQYEDKIKFRIHDMLKLKKGSLTHPPLKDYFPYNRFLLGEYALDLGVPYIQQLFTLLAPIDRLAFSPETLNNTQISTFREILMFHVPNLSSLELIFPRYGYLEFPFLFPAKIFTLTSPVLPSVEKLVLKLPLDRTEFIPQFFIDLFRSIPNLKSLQIFGAHGSFLDFLFSNEAMLEKAPLLKLNNLEIHHSAEGRGEIGQKQLEKLNLVVKKLNLRSLTLSSMTDTIDLKIQKDLLSSVGGNLEKLSILKFSFFDALSPAETLIPGEIKYLKNLKYFETAFLSEAPSLDFVSSMPSLKTLILGKITSELFSLNELAPKFEMVLESDHPLLKLVLPQGLLKLRNEIDQAQTPENEELLVISKILKIFPHLKTFKLSADDKILKSLYKCGYDGYLTTLRELLLFPDSNVTDEGITGIPLSICRDLYKNKCEIPPGVQSIEELRTCTYWIADLKELQIFQLTESDEKSVPKNRISNVSVLFGFRFLKNLTNLSIPKTWITNFSLYYIGKYYTSPLIFVDFSFCYFLTPPGLERLKEEKPHLQIKCKNWYKNLVSVYNRREDMSVPSGSYFMSF